MQSVMHLGEDRFTPKSIEDEAMDAIGSVLKEGTVRSLGEACARIGTILTETKDAHLKRVYEKANGMLGKMSSQEFEACKLILTGVPSGGAE